MYKQKKIAVIIAAAGLGTRMGSGIPKQYMKIGGVPMLLRTAEAFWTNRAVDRIIVVTGASYVDAADKLLREAGIEAVVAVGGGHRQDSIREGLKHLPPDADYVLIHDAARPFVTQALIDKVIDSVHETACAVPAVPLKDTVRMCRENGRESVTLDRDRLFAVQTPQGFEKNLLLKAYDNAFAEGFYGTDDASLVDRLGLPVCLVPGDDANRKITTREDMAERLAENLAEEGTVMGRSMRIGNGFDAHAFAPGRRLVLGGVEIPFEKGLVGHSDADVLLHAIMDALLGAASLGDIGRVFPDSDPAYKDISSLDLLARTAARLSRAGYAAGNIDATLIAERPKIAPYIPQMTEVIAQCLSLAEGQVSIKGTTTEKLGFTGREEGIAAVAVCTLYRITD